MDVEVADSPAVLGVGGGARALRVDRVQTELREVGAGRAYLIEPAVLEDRDLLVLKAARRILTNVCLSFVKTRAFSRKEM
ncbi:MAG: hypothetical protein IJQ80_01035 [Clostridia bacterium]|nr:hypothetical protein [Clostridia bacterium]